MARGGQQQALTTGPVFRLSAGSSKQRHNGGTRAEIPGMRPTDWKQQASHPGAEQPVEAEHQQWIYHQGGIPRQQHSCHSSTVYGGELSANGSGLQPFAISASAGDAARYQSERIQQPTQTQQIWKQQFQQQGWGGRGHYQTSAMMSPSSTSTVGGQPQHHHQQQEEYSSHGSNSSLNMHYYDDGHKSSSGRYAISGEYGDVNRAHFSGSGSSHSGRNYDSRIRDCRSYSSHTYDRDGSMQQQQLLMEEDHQKSVVQEVEQQCMNSLQSSLRMAAETNEISQKTAVKLDEQSEQLKGIRDTTAEIHDNLQTSDYLLKGMKSWWGAFAQLFTSPPASTSKASRKSASEKSSATTAEAGAAAVAHSRTVSRNYSKSSRSCYTDDVESSDATITAFGGIPRSRSDWSAVATGHQQQQQQQLLARDSSSQQRLGAFESDFNVRLEKDLQKLSDMLGEMHERAVAINSNLKQQNGMLNEIERNMDANQSSIAQQKKVLKEIMRK